MSKSPSLRRIQADIRELALDPSDRYHAAPLEHDMFEWHFTIRGADGTDFEGGIYHGRILLPPEYPFKPPHIIFLTPSGRFETNTKVCLSFSAYHPELWQPAWGIRLILEALISFLPTPADGAIGSLDWTPAERKRLAKQSVHFVCPTCCCNGNGITTTIAGLLPKVVEPKSPSKQKKTRTLLFAKEIADLQRLQLETEGAKAKKKTTTSQTTKTDEDNKDTEGTTTMNQGEGDDKGATENVREGDHNNNNNDSSTPKKKEDPTPVDEAAVTTGTPHKDDTHDNQEQTPSTASASATTNNTTTTTTTTSPDGAQSPQPRRRSRRAPTTPPRAREQDQIAPMDQGPGGQPAAAEVQAPGAPEAAANANVNPNPNPNARPSDPSWMVDPLLNVMIVLSAIIIYLLIQKTCILCLELQELYDWDEEQRQRLLLQDEIRELSTLVEEDVQT